MFLIYIFGLVSIEIVLTAKSSSSRGAREQLNSLYPSSTRDIGHRTNQLGHHRTDQLAVEPEAMRSDWQYDNETSWPGRLCREGQGRRQSPINIRTEAVVIDTNRDFVKYGELKLHGYQSVLVSGVNNGRTIQFTMEGDEAMHPTVTGGPLRYLYRLEQLHFHWLSEHAVNGYKYPMEIHFVYIRADLSTAEALRKRDGIAIIAAFGNIKSEVENDDNFLASDMMEEVVRQLPQLSQFGDRVSGIVLNMSKLLPAAEPSYVTYAGSLTSPECNEVVTWIILENPVFMTYGQYKDFANLAKTRYNFRHIQESDLTVYRPSASWFKQPMIFRVFVDMYGIVANFFKNMNTMLRNPTAAKVQLREG